VLCSYFAYIASEYEGKGLNVLRVNQIKKALPGNDNPNKAVYPESLKTEW
jgi:hypothetical protein